MNPARPGEEAIRVAIADDHAMLREGLKMVLAREPGIRIVAEAENGEMAVDLCRRLVPDVILLDIAMGDMTGIEAARLILAESSVEVVIVSMYIDRCFVVEALKAGVKGYVVKSSACAELLRAIREAARHRSYLSPAIRPLLVEELIATRKPLPPLSPREVQVLRLIADGSNTKGTAHELAISTKTVETYRRSLMKKLNMNNVADLTKYAIKHGLIEFQ